MRKNVLWSLAALFFSMLLAAGCQKNDSSVSNTALLTKSKWKITNASVSGMGDVTSQIPACYLDNEYSFFTDGTGTIDESGNVCAPSTEGVFTWQFQDNESVLSMSHNLIPGGNGDFNILLLNETSLTLAQETTLLPSPVPLTIIVTLGHP